MLRSKITFTSHCALFPVPFSLRVMYSFEVITPINATILSRISPMRAILSQRTTDKFQVSIAVIQTKYYIFDLYFLSHWLLLVKHEANKQKYRWFHIWFSKYLLIQIYSVSPPNIYSKNKIYASPNVYSPPKCSKFQH